MVVCLRWSLYGLLTIVSLIVCQSSVDPNKHRVVSPGDKFQFDCPSIEHPDKVDQYQVTWMHDNKIWLKINDGHLVITQELSSFKPDQEAPGRNVVEVSLHDYRYRFDYNERTGRFTMRIPQVQEADAGVWKCTVESSRHDAQHSYLLFSDYRMLSVGTSMYRTSGQRQAVYNAHGSGITGQRHPARGNGVGTNPHSYRAQPVVMSSNTQIETFNAGEHQPATFTQVDSSRAGDVIVFQRTGGGKMETAYDSLNHPKSNTVNNQRYRQMRRLNIAATHSMHRTMIGGMVLFTTIMTTCQLLVFN